jgi:putative Holliday junction resolvase
MDGTEGPQGRTARTAAAELAAATGLDVRLWDERLSSFAADQALSGTMTSGKKKARQDAVAAAAILQDFLASDGPHSAPRPQDVPSKPDRT